MSAHVWKAGDLARYINPAATILTHRAIYRVESVTPFQKWDRGSECVGLVLVGHCHPNNKCGHFAARNFRPIVPAEPAFTEAMRALKPRVDAK